MDAKVAWNGRMTFTGTTETGFPIRMDSDLSVGGDNSGARPLELFLVGLAGCTAMDVISILRKKQQDVRDLEVTVHADQQQEHPHIFTHVTLEYIVTGKNVDPAAVERAIELSITKYCPAQAMLAKVVPIEHKYTIVEVVDTN